MGTTVKNLHREGRILLFDVDSDSQQYRVAVVADENVDGVKIPLIDGIEDRGNTSIIGSNEIRRLRALHREDLKHD